MLFVVFFCKLCNFARQHYVDQWFSNCGTRGLFRWYASSIPVIFEKLC